MSILSPTRNLLNGNETPHQIRNREIELSGRRRLFQSPSNHDSNNVRHSQRLYTTRLEDILEEDILTQNPDKMPQQRSANQTPCKDHYRLDTAPFNCNMDLIMAEGEGLSSFGGGAHQPYRKY